MLCTDAAPGEAGDPAEGGDADSEGGPDPDAMSYEELTALGEVVGTVSTGLTKAQLEALPVKVYAQCRAGAECGAVETGAEEEQ